MRASYHVKPKAPESKKRSVSCASSDSAPAPTKKPVQPVQSVQHVPSVQPVQSVPFRPVKYAYKYDDCNMCGINLKRWAFWEKADQKTRMGARENGFRCPPCIDFATRQDAEKRVHLENVTGKRLGLVIPPNEDLYDPYQIDLKETSVENIVGGLSCIIYRNAMASTGLYTPYMAYMNDTALLGDAFEANDRAQSLIWSLQVFHDDQRCAGPLVFTGPNGMTLFPSEVKDFLRRIKTY